MYGHSVTIPISFSIPIFHTAPHHHSIFLFYHIGCLLAHLLTGLPPFQNNTNRTVQGTFERVVKGSYSLPSTLSADAVDLVKRMLTVDAQQVFIHNFPFIFLLLIPWDSLQRPSIEELTRHPFLDDKSSPQTIATTTTLLQATTTKTPTTDPTVHLRPAPVIKNPPQTHKVVIPHPISVKNGAFPEMVSSHTMMPSSQLEPKLMINFPGQSLTSTLLESRTLSHTSGPSILSAIIQPSVLSESTAPALKVPSLKLQALTLLPVLVSRLSTAVPVRTVLPEMNTNR